MLKPLWTPKAKIDELSAELERQQQVAAADAATSAERVQQLELEMRKQEDALKQGDLKLQQQLRAHETKHEELTSAEASAKSKIAELEAYPPLFRLHH